MKLLRGAMAALLLGGVLSPLGPHALLHALDEAHSHRHGNGVTHSHHHDADHHEHEVSPAPSSEARILPTRDSFGDGGGFVAAADSAGFSAPRPRLHAIAFSHRPGAPPGRRPAPHLGRAPPA